jgi:GGDEF domain-containing protein
MTIAKRVAGKILGLFENRCSIGIAQMREAESVEKLVGRADAALYEAKRQGRGRFATDEVQETRAKAV